MSPNFHPKLLMKWQMINLHIHKKIWAQSMSFFVAKIECIVYNMIKSAKI